jgi:hypothetical protein
MDYPVSGKSPNVAAGVVPHAIDADGKAVPIQQGTAGAPAGGVQSVQEVGTLLDVMGDLADDPVSDPEAVAASIASLLRGVLDRMADDTPTPVVQSGTPTYITTNATTAVRTSAGKLHRLVVSAAGASSNTVRIYDANNDTTGPIAEFTNIAVGVYELMCDMANGITVVTATGTAPKMAVVSSAA